MKTTNDGTRDAWLRDLGGRITELRNILDYSYDEFANWLTEHMVDGGSVSASSLRRWEHGEVPPGLAAWETMKLAARTLDLEFYLTGLSRRDQYQETFANPAFLPESGYLVFLRVRTIEGDDAKVGAYAEVLKVIAEREGQIIRMSTWGEKFEQAQYRLLILLILPIEYKKGRETRLNALPELREQIFSIPVIDTVEMQVRTQDVISFPPDASK